MPIGSKAIDQAAVLKNNLRRKICAHKENSTEHMDNPPYHQDLDTQSNRESGIRFRTLITCHVRVSQSGVSSTPTTNWLLLFFKTHQFIMTILVPQMCDMIRCWKFDTKKDTSSACNHDGFFVP